MDKACILKFVFSTHIFYNSIFEIIIGLGRVRGLPFGCCRQKKVGNNFRSRRWGSSLPALGTLVPPLSPQSTRSEISCRMCPQSHLQTSPPTGKKSNTKFQNPRTTFEIFQNNFFLKEKKSLQGASGGLEIFWRVYIFAPLLNGRQPYVFAKWKMT